MTYVSILDLILKIKLCLTMISFVLVFLALVVILYNIVVNDFYKKA